MADLHHIDRGEGRRRAAELLEAFDLADAGSKIAMTYSGGMRRLWQMASPFLGSAFVPAQSMAPGLRWFAEYQPFTPIINVLRDLLMGAPLGNTGYVAVGWCAGLGLAGYLWARALFTRASRGGR